METYENDRTTTVYKQDHQAIRNTQKKKTKVNKNNDKHMKNQTNTNNEQAK